MPDPASAFVDRLRDAVPGAPDGLGNDYESDQIAALSAYLSRVRAAKRRYRAGKIDRAHLPPRVQARGAAHYVTELAGSEQAAVWRLLAAGARLVAKRAEWAAADGEDLRELLAGADAALTYSLCGWGQECSLVAWLSRDLARSFEAVRASSESVEATTSTTLAAAHVDPATRTSTRPLSELAEPAAWARTLTARDGDLRAVWEHLAG